MPYFYLLHVVVFLLVVMDAAATLGQDDKTTPIELERFQQSGKPQTLADLKPKAVPDEDNAAWWLAKAEAGRLAIDIKLVEEFDFEADCDEEFVRLFKDVVAEHPNTYEWLHKAADAKTCVPFSKFDVGTYLEFNEAHDPSFMRSVARVLMYRSAVELAEGRVNNAAKSALAILQLSGKPNLYFGMSGFLTRMAVQRMGSHSLSAAIESGKSIDPQVLDSIKTELEKLDTLDDFQACFESERLLGIQIMKDQGILMAAARIESYLRAMRIFQENANKTIAEQKELVDESPNLGLIGADLMPAVLQLRQAAHRELTTIRLMRIQIAWLQSPDATEIDNLDLPESAKTDPHNGEKLKIERPGNQ